MMEGCSSFTECNFLASIDQEMKRFIYAVGLHALCLYTSPAGETLQWCAEIFSIKSIRRRVQLRKGLIISMVIFCACLSYQPTAFDIENIDMGVIVVGMVLLTAKHLRRFQPLGLEEISGVLMSPLHRSHDADTFHS